MARRRPESPVDQIVEAHRIRNPRLNFFYFAIAALLLVLVGGLAYRQLFSTQLYSERERLQNQRRIIVPGPRGNLYDRDGRLLVGNRPRFAVVLYLDELRGEFRREAIRIRKNYRALGDADLPTSAQMDQIARATVVQRYLDEVNRLLGRHEQVDSRDLQRHFTQQLLLPYLLVDDLQPAEYAKLIESLPVDSPLQVYTSSTRLYPYASAASQTIGYVVADDDVAIDDFPGEELKTLKMKGSLGRDGLEREYDSRLQGQAGGTIYRVDPAGYRVEPPLEKRLPVQGGNLTTSLDIDLQLAAEGAMQDRTGAAVALDVNTGEVLVLASKPDYNLNDFSPRLSTAVAKQINDAGAWLNRAVNGVYPPGSTFKIITSCAGLRCGAINPDTSTVDCEGYFMVAGRKFLCENGRGDHGVISLRRAIAESCDTYFYKFGIDTGVGNIAAEARRFHLDQPTGIDLPHETRRMLIPDSAWKQKHFGESWFPGDTANMAIGQGYIGVTPLQMACFVASFARGETVTVPTLLHEPNRPRQHTAPIGLKPSDYSAIVDGMELCVKLGTGRLAQIPGIRVAGKTGTAQVRTKDGTLNMAWFICFAPIDHPQIAIAVCMEGQTLDENYAGALYAAPVAKAIMQAYFAKKNRPPAQQNFFNAAPRSPAPVPAGVR